MRNKKYFIFVARLAPENASIFVETRGGVRFPRVRARARTTARRREIPCGRNDNNRIRYAAGRGRPALPTTSSALKPNVRVVISSVSREIPRGGNGTKHTRAGPLTCGGSPPRNPPRWERTQSYPLCGETRASRPTCPQGLPAAPAHSPVAARHLACAGSAPHTPVFLPFGQIECRKVVCKYLQN